MEGQGQTGGWMEGLPLLRFSGGPCFLPVQTEREGGMLIRWIKPQSENTKVCVCVCGDDDISAVTFNL